MEEHRFGTEREEPENPSVTSTARWLAIAAGTAIVAACLAVGYGFHQQTLAGGSLLLHPAPMTCVPVFAISFPFNPFDARSIP